MLADQMVEWTLFGDPDLHSPDDPEAQPLDEAAVAGIAARIEGVMDESGFSGVVETM